MKGNYFFAGIIRRILFSFVLLLMVGCGNSKVLQYGTTSSAAVAFQSTVYKLAREKTCIGCHAKTQTPMFANDDVNVAYEAIMSAQKVNFQKPELSRIYQRLTIDKHNCWYDNDCVASGKEMLDAINKWKESVHDLGQNIGQVTDEKPFLEGGRLPLVDGAYVFEAEDGNIVQPATSAAGNSLAVGHESAASHGSFLFVPEKGRSTLKSALQDFTNYSYVQFSFTARDSNYRFFARVAGNGKADDGFFKFKLNNGNAVPFGEDVAKDGSWVWKEIKPDNGVIANTNNIIKIGELDDGPKLDMILVVPASAVSSFPDVTFSDPPLPAERAQLSVREDVINRLVGRTVTLSYGLTSFLGKDDPAVFKVDASIVDETAYAFNNPRIEGYGKNITVQGIRVLQNGIFNAQDSDWLRVNKIIIPKVTYDEMDADKKANTYQVDGCHWDKYNYLNCNSMLIQRQNGPASDKFIFSFETLAYTLSVPNLNEIALGSDDLTNVTNLFQRLCINCHTNLKADNQTHYLVTDAFTRPNGDPNIIDIVNTARLLREGQLQVGANLVNSRAAEGGFYCERVVRPRVLKNGSQLPGSGGANSILYRILAFGEGPPDAKNPGGTIPAEMMPFRQAIQSDPIRGQRFLDSIKNWIDSLDPVDDLSPPKVRTIAPKKSDLVANDHAILDIRALDDLTQTHVLVYKDNSATPDQTITSADQMREFSKSYDSGTIPNWDVSHKFKVVAVDAAGNDSDHVPGQAGASYSASLSLGGCSLSGISTSSKIKLNVPYTVTGTAANQFALAGQTTRARLQADTEPTKVDTTVTASGTAVASVTRTITFTSSKNQTVQLRVNNNPDPNNPDAPNPDAYVCQKTVDLSTNVSISLVGGGNPTRGSQATLRVTVSNPFEVNINSIELYRRAPNDPILHPITPAGSFSATPSSGSGGFVTRDYLWTPNDNEDQIFTAIATDSQGVATQSKAATFTAQ